MSELGRIDDAEDREPRPHAEASVAQAVAADGSRDRQP